MGQDFYIAVGSLSLAFLFYTWLTYYNYKQAIKTKEIRLALRREQRKNRKAPFVMPI